MKKQLYILMVFIAVSSFGCANTVTPLVDYGSQVAVTLTLRGNLDVNANRYFLVLSPDATFNVPRPYPETLLDAPELLEPGTTPLSGSAEAYQSNFYSTWAGYVIIEPAGYILAQGPLSAEVTPTRETLAHIENISTSVTFHFRLNQLPSLNSGRIYFNVVTAPWVDGSLKLPADYLPVFDNNITTIEGSVKEYEDPRDDSIAAGLDILKVRLEMQ